MLEHQPAPTRSETFPRESDSRTVLAHLAAALAFGSPLGRI
jgi:hypothetical protein